nr:MULTISPECIES: hypothetical protein [Paenibacillus]
MVTVNTANLKDAGTDPNISITRYGTNGDYVTASFAGPNRWLDDVYLYSH